MKKRFVAIMLTVLCLLSSVLFTGCTDDRDKPRVLNDIEQAVCGKYEQNVDIKSRTSFIFNTDGEILYKEVDINGYVSYKSDNPKKYFFFNGGYGYDNVLKRGKFYIIEVPGYVGLGFAYFPDYPDYLIRIYNDYEVPSFDDEFQSYRRVTDDE